MKPYITRIMREASEKGTPVIRPLFYDFSNDPAAWNVEDAYMFGPDMLVAPVLHAGERQREVYLPAGAAWREQETGTKYEGGKAITIKAPLEYIPVFDRLEN
jgi:alpha-D-xyloside xylohydrolase